MGLLGEIQAAQDETARKCRIEAIKASLGKADADALEKALADRSTPYRAIIKALNRRGIQVSDKVCGAHRRRDCRCFKPADG